MDRLFERCQQDPEWELTIDLEQCQVRDQGGLEISFEVDGFRRECLLNGLDDIALTLQQADQIAAYESRHGIGNAS